MNDRVSFDHYCVQRRENGERWVLGCGQAGATYKAVDVNLECPVALKVLHQAAFRDDDERAAFVREAQAAASLRHRNIATVFHLGKDATHYFYAMEFVEGETAEALVKRDGPLAPAMALRIARQACRALAAAGRQGIVHRDIKPANLMIDTNHPDAEGKFRVKVIDFGLAQIAAPAPGESRGFCGTPEYASPEQAEERELDGRSDLYSLGCTLWFLLTGRPPFTGTLANVLVQRLQQEPPWGDLEQVPLAVRKLLRILLRRNPAERPRDAHEAQQAIELCLASLERSGNLGARLHDSAALAHRWIVRHPRRRVAFGATAAVLVAAVSTLVWQMSAKPAAVAASPAMAPAPAVTASPILEVPEEPRNRAPEIAEREVALPVQEAPSNRRPVLQLAAAATDRAELPVSRRAESSSDDDERPAAKPVASQTAKARPRARAKAKGEKSGSGVAHVRKSVGRFFASLF